MIYLDNSATTKCSLDIINKIEEVSSNYFGNPSSLHKLGFEAEKTLKESKEIFSNILNIKTDNIIFTSGGTESNNLALIGYALRNKNKGNHIISSSIEHDSVLNPLKFLSSIGFEISLVEPDKFGIINPEDILKLVKDNTILVSIMHINNEIGSINDIKSISKLVKSHNKNIAIHSDCVQSFGKYDIKNLDADLITLSSHKIHGPKGVGALINKGSLNLNPIIYGGGQQNNLRSGTENVPSIYGFAYASQYMYENFNDNYSRLNDIKNAYLQGIKNLNDKYGNIYLTGPSDNNSSVHIINIIFKGIRAEVLLHSLEEDGIYVGTGSACSSHSKEKSKVLTAIKIPSEDLDSSIRISLGCDNTLDEVKTVIDTLDVKIPLLRKYLRK